MSQDRRETESGIELRPVYDADPSFDAAERLGEPGV